jgi:hypothetical protein
VDETFTSASGTAKARVQNWKKLSSFSNQTDENYSVSLVEANAANWIQFKVWLLNKGEDELYDLTLFNKKHQ